MPPMRPEPRKPLGYQYTCATCGNAFTNKNKGRQFCSRRCARAARDYEPMVPRVCPVCGGPMATHVGKPASKYAHIKTCSRQCGHELTARQLRGRPTARRLPPLEPRPCRRCGREFVPTNRTNKGIYCSVACHLADLHEERRSKRR